MSKPNQTYYTKSLSKNTHSLEVCQVQEIQWLKFFYKLIPEKIFRKITYIVQKTYSYISHPKTPTRITILLTNTTKQKQKT